MPKLTAGILLYRRPRTDLEVLLVHPGGPFWARKDDGAWSIPKGEVKEGEDLIAAARREVEEETGLRVTGEMIPLHPMPQKSGKVIHAWAKQSDFVPSELKSNTFKMEWPPKSGRLAEFPEVDRAEWFSMDRAREKILKGQVRLLDELEHIVQSQAD